MERMNVSGFGNELVSSYGIFSWNLFVESFSRNVRSIVYFGWNRWRLRDTLGEYMESLGLLTEVIIC